MPCVEFESRAEALRDAFVSIMTKGVKNNTYKFALGRFLLDHCRGATGETMVRYEVIAGSFFDYYWMQECRSKLRQGPENQTPEVIQIIRKRFDKDYYPQDLDKIKKKEPDAVAGCIDAIRAACFDDVVPRFEEDAERYFGKQRGKPAHRRVFYDYMAREYKDSADNKMIDSGGGIRLNPHAIRVLRENYEPLFQTVVLGWIRFLEKRNFGMPCLAEKISGNILGPRDQNRFKKYLEPFADRCFYCNSKLKPGRCTHVDHVLPYDYVGTTDMWNLVLACQKCNCTKLGSLPPEHYIIKLKKRNVQYRGRGVKQARLLDAMGGEPDIDWHYGNARKHGYPPWPGPAR